MRFCLEKLGMTPLGGIEPPGFLEGGDFFPAGPDLCMVGVGLRSNIAAVEQCMRKDWFGTRRVAVVKDDHDQSQDRMHLDCACALARGGDHRERGRRDGQGWHGAGCHHRRASVPCVAAEGVFFSVVTVTVCGVAMLRRV